MSLRRVDARFLLPHAPASAVVVGDLPGWVAGLRAAGVDTDGTGAPDLVVGTVGTLDECLSTGAPMAIVEGLAPAAALRAHGLIPSYYLALPGLDGPEVLVPLDQPQALRYLLDDWRIVPGYWRQLRNRAFARASRLGPRVWPASRVLTVAAGGGAPFPAAPLGAAPAGWILVLGAPHAAGRAALLLFPPGGRTPDRVVKFFRLPGFRDCDGDLAAMDMVAAAGPPVSSHAPTLVDRYDAGGLTCLVETAAVGHRLTDYLRGPAPRASKLDRIDKVVDWLIAAARLTAAPPQTLTTERALATEDIRAHWGRFDVPADLVEQIPDVPAVLRHGDLWSGNVIIDGDGFMVIDWSEAVPASFPLADLVYFLTESLGHVDQPRAQDTERDRHFVALWKGEAPSSGYLFTALRRMIDALELPAEAVAPLVALTWVSLSRSERRSEEPVSITSTYSAGSSPPCEHLTSLWFGDADLNLRWGAWARA